MRANCIVVLSTTVALMGITAHAEQPRSDLTGLWQLVSTSEPGKAGAAADVSKKQLVLSERSFSFVEDGIVTQEGSFSERTAKDVHSMDLTWAIDRGKSSRQSSLGIYEIQGETLKLCFSAPSPDEPNESSRPTKFNSTQEPPIQLSIYRRVPIEPKSIEEGLARMEQILGRYQSDNQAEWRIPTEFEFRHRPDPKDNEVLVRFKGIKTIGNPYRSGQSLCFDETMQWQRSVYDVDSEGRESLSKTQTSHYNLRYALTQRSGVWLAEGAMLSNGVHESNGKNAFAGVVKWHADGFELIGSVGIDQYYAAGGKLILGTDFGKNVFFRRIGRLNLMTQRQPYHLATHSDGTLTAFPDFARPIGTAYVKEFQSDPVAQTSISTSK